MGFVFYSDCLGNCIILTLCTSHTRIQRTDQPNGVDTRPCKIELRLCRVGVRVVGVIPSRRSTSCSGIAHTPIIKHICSGASRQTRIIGGAYRYRRATSCSACIKVGLYGWHDANCFPSSIWITSIVVGNQTNFIGAWSVKCNIDCRTPIGIQHVAP